jgi:putative tryptophan/tyrosine transport system substrate-binding protein
VKRREFIAGLGSAVAWPLAARAQQRPATSVIGYLHPGTSEGEADSMAAFHRGLGEAGYAQGRNVSIEYRWGHNDSARLPGFAADLVARQVAVIATPGSSEAALAAKAATSTIPIIFSSGDDPVRAGLVASFNRPGGNVTGYSSMNVELVPKRFGLLHQLVPRAARFALLINPSLMTNSDLLIAVQAAASTIGVQVEAFSASTPRDIETAFESMVLKRVDALIVGAGAPFRERHVQLSTLATFHRLPAIYTARDYALAGGLMSYGPAAGEQFRSAGMYTGLILRGEKPADLPVLRPTKFLFVVNLQTARVLGIKVPETLLATADEVIE